MFIFADILLLRSYHSLARLHFYGYYAIAEGRVWSETRQVFVTYAGMCAGQSDCRME